MAAFEQALSAPDLTVSSGAEGAAERRAEARAGMARCAILLGDVERGMELASEGGSQPLLLQCAELLEGEGWRKEVRWLGLWVEAQGYWACAWWCRQQRSRHWCATGQLFLLCLPQPLRPVVPPYAGGPAVCACWRVRAGRPTVPGWPRVCPSGRRDGARR